MVIWKAVTLLGLALCAQGEPHATSEQMVKQEFVPHHGHHGELNHIGSHEPEHHEGYAWAYPSYEFSYSVNDPHTHDHKGQYEQRHGDEVKGEYWLLQPDGKKRTVKYESDKHKGFKAQVHFSEHEHIHQHREEPPRQEIIKPVVEVIEEEILKPIEESEPVVVEEVPEVVVEEREEERREPEIHKPIHHKPIHIEYYINHKYQKHHHEEHKHAAEERREEESAGEERVGESGQEARIQENEEPQREIGRHKSVHIEYYTKTHHPIHNEHHGHEIPKTIHREYREERKQEQTVREEQRTRKEHRGREQNRRVNQLARGEEHGREEDRAREEESPREEERNREEQRVREEHRGRKEQRGREEQRDRIERKNWEEHRHRENEGEERNLPPLLRPLNIGHHRERIEDRGEEEYRPIKVEEIRPERRHDPHVQLLQLHKPVLFRPEHDRHSSYQREYRKPRNSQ